MAWTAPMTFSVGAVLTAAQLNTYLRDNENAILSSATTLNSTVVSSSLTSVGTLTGLTMGGAINCANNIISNIGAAGTDFTATGGLTLADTLTVAGGGVNVTGGVTLAGTTTNLVFARPSVSQLSIQQVATSGDLIINNDTSGTEQYRWTNGGKAFIKETVNTNMTIGLTINQAGADDQIFAGKSSDLSHPFTGLVEDDTYFDLMKSENTSGGLTIRAWKSSAGAAGYALSLMGNLGEAADTTDTTASVGVNYYNARVTDGGTSVAAVAATGNAHVFANNGSGLMLLKGNGDMHIVNTTLTALDAEDDLALVRTYQRQTSGGLGLLMNRWDETVRTNAQDLKRVGVLSSQGHFVVQQRVNALLGGAIWQVGTALYDLRELLRERTGQLTAALSRLTAVEQRLALLGGVA